MAIVLTAGQSRLDRGQSCAAGTLYVRSMGVHGTRYSWQGRGPGTSTAASNYAKLAPARGAWSCLPPPLLLAASSAALSCEPASLLLFSPVHTPSTPAVHPPCFPLVVSPASTESALCGLERHAHTQRREAHLRFLPASRSACFRRAIALGIHPCHASDSSCELSVQRRQQPPTNQLGAS